jgi:hypothetical protein
MRPELQDCVLRSDAEGFLLVYFGLIEKGENLTVPSQINQPDLAEEWRDILADLGIKFSDDFLDQLANFYRKALKKLAKKEIRSGDVFRILKQGLILG